ncbi:hypothetical protein [Fluviispira sanaruensis]|uniref:Uncharacterized protein n=1 Tax=Fluviispira sanaruensis TaxID=2493639 RepID=A0A4V0P214_FLUSA|nr:hypothetical protein [Fluviispira sanaruensis]BBH51637.1 hypothetical protein JCM31447_00540 [Fluviispira sanaruensis]
MAVVRSKLISALISKKLNKKIDEILSILRQGFDVQIKTGYLEVENKVLELLEQQLKINSREFLLFTDSEKLYAMNEKSEVEDSSFMPIIFVGNSQIRKGYGFIAIELPSPDLLLTSIPSAISTILNYFNLNIYLDIFDSNKLLSLKKITIIHGLNLLIDSVVQTAYLGGFRGESEDAQRFLDQTQSEVIEDLDKKEVPLEKCAEKFFSYVLLRGEDAHSFLKSSFIYYSITLQGLSMTRASQIFSVSRTTLLGHLKTAEKLGVSHFFEGYIQKSI